VKPNFESGALYHLRVTALEKCPKGKQILLSCWWLQLILI